MSWILFLVAMVTQQSRLPPGCTENGRFEKLPFPVVFRRDPANYLRMATMGGGGEKTEEALSSALEALAECQASDGSWEPGAGGSRVEVTSLALLAYLTAGWNTWDQGTLPVSAGWRRAHAAAEAGPAPPFHRVLRRGISYLLHRQSADGFIGGREASRSLRDHAVGSMALSEAYGWIRLALLRGPAEKAMEALMVEASCSTEADPEAAGWTARALRSAALAGLPYDSGTWNRLIPRLLTPAAGIPRKGAVDLVIWNHLRRSGHLPEVLHRNPPSRNLPSVDLRDWYWGSAALAPWDALQGPLWKSWNERMKSELLSMKPSDAESLAFVALALETYYPDNVHGLK